MFSLPHGTSTLLEISLFVVALTTNSSSPIIWVFQKLDINFLFRCCEKIPVSINTIWFLIKLFSFLSVSVVCDKGRVKSQIYAIMSSSIPEVRALLSIPLHRSYTNFREPIGDVPYYRHYIGAWKCIKTGISRTSNRQFVVAKRSMPFDSLQILKESAGRHSSRRFIIWRIRLFNAEVAFSPLLTHIPRLWLTPLLICTLHCNWQC